MNKTNKIKAALIFLAILCAFGCNKTKKQGFCTKTARISSENIYIVEDNLNILKSKKIAKIYIEQAFAYLLQNSSGNTFYTDILEKKDKYSVQLFSKKDGEKDVVFLNFFILDYKSDDFYTKRVVVWDGGSYFWHISYDVQKDEFFDVWINY